MCEILISKAALKKYGYSYFEGVDSWSCTDGHQIYGLYCEINDMDETMLMLEEEIEDLGCLYELDDIKDIIYIDAHCREVDMEEICENVYVKYESFLKWQNNHYEYEFCNFAKYYSIYELKQKDIVREMRIKIALKGKDYEVINLYSTDFMVAVGGDGESYDSKEFKSSLLDVETETTIRGFVVNGDVCLNDLDVKKVFECERELVILNSRKVVFDSYEYGHSLDEIKVYTILDGWYLLITI